MPDAQGDLNWRLSAHPFTLLTFLTFRLGALLMYLFGVLFIRNFILVFILTLLLLSLDFYYLKNIAGRRLVRLRWWNEVDVKSGDSHWVFESRETQAVTQSAGAGGEQQNATDKRFFWLAMYSVPVMWVGLAVLAIVRLQSLIWLVTIGESCTSISMFRSQCGRAWMGKIDQLQMRASSTRSIPIPKPQTKMPAAPSQTPRKQSLTTSLPCSQ